MEVLFPPSMPLASRRKLNFPRVELSLNPGQRLLFYTDGLVEAQMPDGQPLGYQRSFAEIAELIDDDPVGSQQRIVRRHEELTEGAPAGDDITILLICRQEAT